MPLVFTGMIVIWTVSGVVARPSSGLNDPGSG